MPQGKPRKRSRTFHEGASWERQSLRRKIQRMLRFARAGHPRYGNVTGVNALKELLAFVDTRRGRYEKRPGGLGRKRKAGAKKAA